ncbi:MAG: type II toxin-antitoxin system Phd/YefM family antitoxin [Symploca sp. SIO2B6]|nr:type II toxin-antitoxin system Phd/YefM family antitoxin [Symploca sp. SIO2B6]
MALNVNSIRSLTDFRRRSKDYVEELQETNDPIVLTVNGEAAIVLQSATAFQSQQDRILQLEIELNQLKQQRLTSHQPSNKNNLVAAISQRFSVFQEFELSQASREPIREAIDFSEES